MHLMTTAEVAVRLGKSKRTVHGLVKSGRLKPAASVKSRFFLFHEQDVARLQASTVPTDAA
jgi:excisionase family DNA binding protein